MLYFLIAEEGTKEGDDSGGPFISESGENDGGQGVRAGCVARARSGHACLRLRVGQQSWVSELGWLEEKGRLGRSVAWASSSLFSFFCFSFLLICLNSNLVWNFECKIGVPYSLEF